VTDSHEIGRRDAIKISGATALSTGLAGCGSILADSDRDRVDQTEDEIPDEPIEIGAQTFLEGGPYLLGQDSQIGYELAVKHINEAGGVAGRELNLELVDEGQGAIQNYERFVNQGKDIAFGVLSSGNSTSLAPVVEDNELINICPDGATYTLFEETVTDPKYFFRMSPPDAGEAIVMAQDAINAMGAESINTVASVNQNYAWGQSQHDIFSQTIQKLTGADMGYVGFPELGAEDYSTHIQEVNSLQPDVLMTSKWGADLVLFMRQAAANDMFENVDLLVGSIGTSVLSELERSELESWGEMILGGRILGSLSDPSQSIFPPNQMIEEDIISEYGKEVMPVSGFFGSSYASVLWYATAVEKAVRTLGRFPGQDELASIMSNHGFTSIAGIHATDYSAQNGRQMYSNLYSGNPQWNEKKGYAEITDINIYEPHQVTPPAGRKVKEWINGW
jgi:branched-chain amino acid transport system substrate-binding protein